MRTLVEGRTAVITGDNLSFRMQPTLDCRVIRYLSEGTEVEIIRRAGSPVQVGSHRDYFYLVELSSGSRGYVYGHYLRMLPDESRTTTTRNQTSPTLETPGYARCTGTNVRYRYGPGLDRRILGRLDRNQKVHILAKSRVQDTINGHRAYWYRIQTEYGRIAWVFGQFLEAAEKGDFYIRPAESVRSNRGYPWMDVTTLFPLDRHFYWKWKDTFYQSEMYITREWTEGANQGWECLVVQKDEDEIIHGWIERYLTTDLRLMGTQYFITEDGSVSATEFTALQKPFTLGQTWIYNTNTTAKIVDVHYQLRMPSRTFDNCLVVALYEHDPRNGIVKGQRIQEGMLCTFQYWKPEWGLIAEKKVRAATLEEIPNHTVVPYFTRTFIETKSMEDIIAGTWLFERGAGYDQGIFNYTFHNQGIVEITVDEEYAQHASLQDRSFQGHYILEDRVVQIEVIPDESVDSHEEAFITGIQEWELRLVQDQFQLVSLDGMKLVKQ